MKLDINQIETIGKEHNLTGKRLLAFCLYVSIREFTRDDYYVREWAGRFKARIEWSSSDAYGTRVLSWLAEHIGGW